MQKALVSAWGHKRFFSFNLRRREYGFEPWPVGWNLEVLFVQLDTWKRFILSPCERIDTHIGGALVFRFGATVFRPSLSLYS